MKSTLLSNQIMLDTKLHMLPNLKQYTWAVRAVNKPDIEGSELNCIKYDSKAIADSDDNANNVSGIDAIT